MMLTFFLEPVAMHTADTTASARAADTTASACHADTTASNGRNPRKETDPASKLLQADALIVTGPEGVAYGTYNWEPVTKGKNRFLRIVFRFSTIVSSCSHEWPKGWHAN